MVRLSDFAIQLLLAGSWISFSRFALLQISGPVSASSRNIVGSVYISQCLRLDLHVSQL